MSALTCLRVHRGVGIAATFAAVLVAFSTLFTKQHYVVDVIAGALMAVLAFWIFIQSQPRVQVPELDRQVAPTFAWGILACAGLGVAGYWMAFQLLGGSAASGL